MLGGFQRTAGLALAKMLAGKIMVFGVIGAGGLYLVNRYLHDQQVIGAQAYELRVSRQAARAAAETARRSGEDATFAVEAGETLTQGLAENRATLQVQRQEADQVEAGEPCPTGCTVEVRELDYYVEGL